MKLKELVAAMIAQTKFVAGRPFEVSISCNWGEIQFSRIYEVKEGVATWHQVKRVGSEWKYWGDPMPFEQLRLDGASSGCWRINSFVRADTIVGFTEVVTRVLTEYFERYSKQLDDERKKFEKGIALINEYIPEEVNIPQSWM